MLQSSKDMNMYFSVSENAMWHSTYLCCSALQTKVQCISPDCPVCHAVSCGTGHIPQQVVSLRKNIHHPLKLQKLVHIKQQPLNLVTK